MHVSFSAETTDDTQLIQVEVSHCNETASLEKSVLTALKRSPHAELAQIRVSVREGVVTLSGELPTFFLKQVAQEVVKRVRCVSRVRNECLVRNAEQCE
jgi:osmotically-inducible protein OsmY